MPQPPDDRGNPYAPLTPRSLAAAATGPDPNRAAVARHLRNAVDAESRRWTCGRFLAAILAGFAIVMLTGGMVASLRLSPPIGLLVFASLCIATQIAFHRSAQRKVGAELARTAVASGLCGQCAYTLRDLQPAPDGCVTCPECGAAWSAVRVTVPHWDAPAPPSTTPPRLVRLRYGVHPAKRRLAPDDRGRFVPIVDSRFRALPAARRAAIGIARISTLTRQLRALGRAGRVCVALPHAFMGLIVGLGTANVWIEDPDQQALAIFLAVLSVVFCAGAIGIFLGHSFYNYRRAARIIADAGLCPSCGATLTGLSQAPDGLTVCPDCRAAWDRRPRLRLLNDSAPRS